MNNVLMTSTFYRSEVTNMLINYMYYKLTVYKLFSDNHNKSTLVTYRLKSGRFVTSSFNVPHSTNATDRHRVVLHSWPSCQA